MKRYLEEMVGDLLSHVLVSLEDGLCDEPHHDAVQRARVEHVGRVVQLFMKPDCDGKLLEVLGAAETKHSQLDASSVMLVAQCIERSLLTSEIPSSNPAIVK